MKNQTRMILASLLLTFGFLANASAWVSSEPTEKLYSFKFRLQKDTYEYSQNAASYEDAFDKAAQACYKHFKAGRRLSEDTGLDIIDVCANPRTI